MHDGSSKVASMHLLLPVTKVKKIGNFLCGLDPIIRHYVHLTSATTFREVVDGALGAEHDELEIQQWRAPQSSSSRPWKKPNTVQTKGNLVAKTLKPVCSTCKKEHYAEQKLESSIRFVFGFSEMNMKAGF